MPAFTDRTPGNLEENRLTQKLAQLRKEQQKILDLTVSNPTQCGFSYLSTKILSPLQSEANLNYDPAPQGLLKARMAIVQYYEARGIHLLPDQVFITANTSEAYSFIFKLLFKPGDFLLCPQPSYPLMDYLAALNDITLKRYSLGSVTGWDFDFSTLRSQVNEKAILIVNPNNPTGHYLDPAGYQSLIQHCKKNNLAVLSDEVFWDYPIESSTFPIQSLASNTEVLTFTLSGISKILGLPQMKLSWMIVSGPETIRREAISRLEVISDTYLSASTPAQNALSEWLKHSEEIQQEIKKRLFGNYQTLKNLTMSHSLLKTFPVQGGWHIPIQIKTSDSDETFALNLLEAKRVLIHPGYLFDFTEEGFFVLSLLSPERVFKEGLSRILSFLPV